MPSRRRGDEAVERFKVGPSAGGIHLVPEPHHRVTAADRAAHRAPRDVPRRGVDDGVVVRVAALPERRADSASNTPPEEISYPSPGYAVSSRGLFHIHRA